MDLLLLFPSVKEVQNFGSFGDVLSWQLREEGDEVRGRREDGCGDVVDQVVFLWCEV